MIDKISVIMTAYNHEQYIRDAIKSVLDQKGTFELEIIIHDDASSDKTPMIMKEYEANNSDKIKCIYQKKNQYSKGVDIWSLMIQQSTGEYIAICECDDYWCDQWKLSKQLSILKTYEDCSFVMHNVWILNEKNKTRDLLNTFPKTGFYEHEDNVKVGLGTRFPATASYFFRKKDWNNMPAFFLQYSVKDYPVRQYYACLGKIYYFSEPMSVYRYLCPGSYMEGVIENRKKDSSKYLKYITEMDDFYTRYDEYTNFKFHIILQKKIISDILGLFISVESDDIERMVADKKLNPKIIETINDMMLNNKRVPELLDFYYKKDNCCWIYGTSDLSCYFAERFVRNGYKIDGFVVSDGYKNCDEIMGYPVYCLSTILEKFETPFFIVATQPINSDGIIKNLINLEDVDYYNVFDIGRFS